MEIIPFQSIGPLAFGDKREDIRIKLGGNFSPFRKVAGECMTDTYDSLGLHLYYDENGHLEFVEAFEPALVTISGVNFLGKSLPAALREMELLGFTHEDADVGVDFPAVGIAITVTSEVIEGVAAYRKGYYDD